MGKDKLPLRIRAAARVAKVIGGQSYKSFIPPLSMFDGYDGPDGIKEYKTAVDQVAANIGWAFAANSAITDPTSAVELQLFRRKADGDREEIKDHEILDLLRAPHLAFTGEEMLALHYGYLNFVGDSYLYMRSTGSDFFEPGRGRLPSALEIFPAHEVSFKLGDDGYTSSIVKRGSRDYPITAFLRQRRASLSDPYQGQSIISAAAASLGTEEQMKQWNLNLFANGAKPGMIMTFNNPNGSYMSDEVFNRLKQQIDDQQSGTANAHRPLLLEYGDAKPYMMSQQDLDFIASRKFSRDEILAMFKVSPGMVGIVENVNRANLDAGFYINAIINVLPRVRQFVAVVNANLVKPYDPSLELSFVNPVPEDVEAKLAFAKAAAGDNAFYSVDEVRNLYGEKPLPEGTGEHVLVPGTVRPLEQALQAPQSAPTTPPANDPNADTSTDPQGDGSPADSGTEANKHMHTALDGVKKKTLRLRQELTAATQK